MKFTIKANSIKYIETRSGVAYTADLCIDGVKVGTIQNLGDGGDTSACTDSDTYDKLLAASSAYSHSAEPVHEMLEQLMNQAEGL